MRSRKVRLRRVASNLPQDAANVRREARPAREWPNLREPRRGFGTTAAISGCRSWLSATLLRLFPQRLSKSPPRKPCGHTWREEASLKLKLLKFTKARRFPYIGDYPTEICVDSLRVLAGPHCRYQHCRSQTNITRIPAEHNFLRRRAARPAKSSPRNAIAPSAPLLEKGVHFQYFHTLNPASEHPLVAGIWSFPASVSRSVRDFLRRRR